MIDNKNTYKFSLDNCNYENEESLYALMNGKIGIRGTFEENFVLKEGYHDNTYMYGMYETSPIVYGEVAYGYAKNHQTIVPLANPHGLAIYVDDQLVSHKTGKVIFHERYLDLFHGTLNRVLEWESDTGKRLKITYKRLTPNEKFVDFLLSVEICALNFSGEVEVKSSASYNYSSTLDEDDPRVKELQKDALLKTQHIISSTHITTHSTKKSDLTVHLLNRDIIDTSYSLIERTDSCRTYTVKVEENKAIQFQKTAYYTRPSETKNLEELVEFFELVSFKDMKSKHYVKMKDFWNVSDIEIEGNKKLQRAIRYNLFQLYHSAGTDGLTNMAAKGLSGPGYEGHYFWDTEMYMLPFFIHTQPEIARKLLEYRHSILPNAKRRALEMGHSEGALFAWRTINGDECSAYYPAGTAQYHINADIAYAVVRYYEITKDDQFMIKYGLDILTETARWWAQVGHFNPRKNNQYCIDGVTGPDEYTAIVNNNYYTNRLAQFNLLKAAEFAEKFNAEVNLEERTDWINKANHMYLPYDENLKLTMQDDSFFDKEVWDFENTPDSHYPLLLHYHPLTIYKYQVNKQADTILSHYLFSDQIEIDQLKRDYDYYEKITTHDSSLSKSIFSVMASQVGDTEKAYQYLLETVYTDIDDIQGNVKDGLHIANMGGMWIALIFGFAGLYFSSDNDLAVSNNLPDSITSMKFKVKYRDEIKEFYLEQ